MLTATQIALLAERTQQALVAFTFKTYYYCTGDFPVSISSTVYSPKKMTWERIQLSSGFGPQTSVILDDTDGTLRADWFTSKFSGEAATLMILLRDPGGGWETVLEMDWTVTKVSSNRAGELRLFLSGAAGIRPRAILEVASRTTFSLAPEPGEVMLLNSGRTIQWRGGSNPPPEPPGGENTRDKGKQRGHRHGGGGYDLVSDVLTEPTQAESPGGLNSS